MLAYDDWYRVISGFERGRGWGEGKEYDSSKEYYNCHEREVGPCRNDFGYIVPEREDLRFEYHYGEDGMDYARRRHEKGEIQEI